MSVIFLYFLGGILLGSPLAVAKAAATLPGLHTEHRTQNTTHYIIENINRQEQLKDRTTDILKKAHVAYISMHTHKLSGSNRRERRGAVSNALSVFC